MVIMIRLAAQIVAAQIVAAQAVMSRVVTQSQVPIPKFSYKEKVENIKFLPDSNFETARTKEQINNRQV